jgi:hypothetical protein
MINIIIIIIIIIIIVHRSLLPQLLKLWQTFGKRTPNEAPRICTAPWSKQAKYFRV